MSFLFLRRLPSSWYGRVMEIDERVLAAKFEALLPHLDERQRRLVLGAPPAPA